MLSEHYVSRACDHIAHLAVIQYRNTWNPGCPTSNFFEKVINKNIYAIEKGIWRHLTIS